MTPLYGHNSFETAYRVDSYPYGSLRCRIWFWLEFGGENKGYRFVSQTENPKNGRMNAPKKSTYARFAGNMYLDENNHVQWACITEGSGAAEIHSFVQRFPKCEANHRILEWCTLKRAYNERCLQLGKTPYGPLSETSREEKVRDNTLLTETIETLRANI